MLMVTAVNPPMVQVQPLKINQQRAPLNQQKVPQQRLKTLQAVLLILLQPLKAKQTVPQLPDNFIPVKHLNELSLSGTVAIR